jgi:hypothetical protein
MLTLIRVCACYALALVLSLLLLGALMFTQQFALIDGWLLSGQPLTQLLLLLPAPFWQALTGVAEAASHPALRSFLQFSLALAQFALLPAAVCYRLWYRP